MSDKEKINIIDILDKGLKQSYENLLRHKAALDQDMVFGDENGQPRIVPAREALAEYERVSKQLLA
ncbi:MAG: hypothetical protein K2H47_11300 [Muribaculaceae bacterium]|nr:hypothetical protein [Muribaculaceae bacterium]